MSVKYLKIHFITFQFFLPGFFVPAHNTNCLRNIRFCANHQIHKTSSFTCIRHLNHVLHFILCIRTWICGQFEMRHKGCAHRLNIHHAKLLQNLLHVGFFGQPKFPVFSVMTNLNSPIMMNLNSKDLFGNTKILHLNFSLK